MKIKMRSTRGQCVSTIDEAILSGIAADGGLFVPDRFPDLTIKKFYEYGNLIDFSVNLLSPFFSDSKIDVNNAFFQKFLTFSFPLHHLFKKNYVLELFHGPTLSCKDLGAQFFSECLLRLIQDKNAKVLATTSGDTGAAIAYALRGKKELKGIILFPKDKISFRQQMQITCWGENIRALAVNGSFDQCQQLAKLAFAKSEYKGILTTANSMNIARLLPQVIFYAFTSIQLALRHNYSVNFIVPSGNLGNVTACHWAKMLGFPIDQILIANNINSALSEFLLTGVFQSKSVIKTLATAMDVGDPSNLERLFILFNSYSECKKQMNAESVSDEQIKQAIMHCYNEYHYIICPHTATAYHRLSSINQDKPCVIVAPAHPAKFAEVLEPLLKKEIPVPKQLKILLDRKQHYSIIEPNYQSLYYFLVE
ncbi:threonine synthase [Legionella sp. PATHC032]|uniref:threonine synthase n=1 Tax=Legionella sp. PATHC032 TaxID=2992039 RepID=UPI001B275985|nr:threonine synthase [Legionella sp. PATHC032]MCW8421526.1 threonine synthase [Legionella sp. PATHC032]HAZ7572536.1 threonine synthase [Legionella pneumophila]HBA1633890.1 threonine synthase [Legionella pneumophila]